MSEAAVKHKVLLSLRGVGLNYKRKTGTFKRKEFWALKSVTLDVHAGESLGVIGRNGSGKTTLLQLLAGIISPDRGELINHGDHRATMLSINVGAVEYLSGRENAVLSGMLLGLSRKQVHEKMDEIIAFSELEESIDEPLNTYSAGMRARLGFSVAFQADPDIVLLDEVLGVGDAPFKVKSRAAMRERIKSNKTIVLVSHSLPTVIDLCDRVVWIEDGTTMAEGDPEEIVKQYEEWLVEFGARRNLKPGP